MSKRDDELREACEAAIEDAVYLDRILDDFRMSIQGVESGGKPTITHDEVKSAINQHKLQWLESILPKKLQWTDKSLEVHGMDYYSRFNQAIDQIRTNAHQSTRQSHDQRSNRSKE